jgi:hypothetical protein
MLVGRKQSELTLCVDSSHWRYILTLPSRVNAVETLYSAFPMFMYIDPKLGGLLLEPLFRLQATPNYTIPYAAPDLGTF